MKHAKIPAVVVASFFLAGAAGAQSVGDAPPAGTGTAVGTAPAVAIKPSPNVAPPAGTTSAVGSGAGPRVQDSKGRGNLGKGADAPQ